MQCVGQCAATFPAQFAQFVAGIGLQLSCASPTFQCSVSDVCAVSNNVLPSSAIDYAMIVQFNNGSQGASCPGTCEELADGLITPAPTQQADASSSGPSLFLLIALVVLRELTLVH